MKATEASNSVVKGLQRAAREAKVTGDKRGAIALLFDRGYVVTQLILGDVTKRNLFEAIGAVEVLKNDLLNQADQLQQDEV